MTFSNRTHSIECGYAECHNYLNVIMLNAVKWSVIMQSVIMFSVIVPNFGPNKASDLKVRFNAWSLSQD